MQKNTDRRIKQQQWKAEEKCIESRKWMVACLWIPESMAQDLRSCSGHSPWDAENGMCWLSRPPMCASLYPNLPFFHSSHTFYDLIWMLLHPSKTTTGPLPSSAVLPLFHPNWQDYILWMKQSTLSCCKYLPVILKLFSNPDVSLEEVVMIWRECC